MGYDRGPEGVRIRGRAHGVPRGAELDQHPILRLQREAGNKVVSALVALQHGDARDAKAVSEGKRFGSPSPRKVLQRVKLFVAGADDTEPGESVHINDYHFADRLHLVREIGSSSGAHTVITKPFSDFNGLAVEAGIQKREGRARFRYQGYEWERHPSRNEIWPVPGPGCVELGLEHLQAVVGYARDGTMPSREMTRAAGVTAVIAAIGKPNARDPGADEPDPEKVSFDFYFDRSALPANVRYKQGKTEKKDGTEEAFVYPATREENNNLFHVHLFYWPGPGQLKRVFRALCTSRSSANHFDVGKDEWDAEPSPSQRDDQKRAMALLHTIVRSNPDGAQGPTWADLASHLNDTYTPDELRNALRNEEPLADLLEYTPVTFELTYGHLLRPPEVEGERTKRKGKARANVRG